MDFKRKSERKRRKRKEKKKRREETEKGKKRETKFFPSLRRKWAAFLGT